jgi:glucosyl-dolichyl phosphate glucuronosyltransferase
MAKVAVPPSAEWEVIVVDNNSTDDTQVVLESHLSTLPLRAVIEHKQGHSHARNRAVDEATGELIIWTDDDVIVDSNWLVEYVKAVSDHPDAGFFAGTVEPLYESQPPAWVSEGLDRLVGPFALCQLGFSVRPLVDGEFPVGANMAFRASVLKEHRFRTDLGRVGKKLTSGDDTEMFERLKKAGLAGIWVGNAIVKHHVPTIRMTRRYVWDWQVGAGRTELRQNPQQAGSRWFGVPRWTLKQCAKAYACAVAWRCFDSRRWLTNYCRAAALWGLILDYRANGRGVRASESR